MSSLPTPIKKRRPNMGHVYVDDNLVKRMKYGDGTRTSISKALYPDCPMRLNEIQAYLSHHDQRDAEVAAISSIMARGISMMEASAILNDARYRDLPKPIPKKIKKLHDHIWRVLGVKRGSHG